MFVTHPTYIQKKIESKPKSPEHRSLALLATFNFGLNQQQQPQRPVYLDDDVSVYGGQNNRPHAVSGPAYASSSHHHQHTQRPIPVKPQPQVPLDYPQEDYGDVNAVDAGQQTGNARYRGNQCWKAEG